MAQLVNAKATIDAEGNLHVHGMAALGPLNYQRTSAGVPQDIHADTLTFEISGVQGASVLLAAGADNFNRTILAPQAIVALIPLRTPTPWAVIDMTSGSPIVRLSGLITAYGFNAAPPT